MAETSTADQEKSAENIEDMIKLRISDFILFLGLYKYNERTGNLSICAIPKNNNYLNESPRENIYNKRDNNEGLLVLYNLVFGIVSLYAGFKGLEHLLTH